MKLVLFALLSAAAFVSAARPATNSYVSYKSSGEQWSGEGLDWSGWYYLRADPPRPGYTIKSSEFALAGDRKCGSWAECADIAHSPVTSTWQFRMQGHNEQLQLKEFYVDLSTFFSGQFNAGDVKSWPSVRVTVSGKKATSTGLLKVTYTDTTVALPDVLKWTKTRTEWSGRSSSYSPWFDLESEPAPAGYSISDVHFDLTGDRRCGDWSHCEQVSRTTQTAKWRFQMQGHSEDLSGGQRQSTGVLTTTYKKSPSTR